MSLKMWLRHVDAKLPKKRSPASKHVVTRRVSEKYGINDKMWSEWDRKKSKEKQIKNMLKTSWIISCPPITLADR